MARKPRYGRFFFNLFVTLPLLWYLLMRWMLWAEKS